MIFKPPKGWEPESDTLFIHADGTRIERRLYRDKKGWFLIPTDLDQQVVYFDPTPEGRDQAFTSFSEGLLAKAIEKKAHRAESIAKARRGRKPKEIPEDPPEETEEEGGPEEAPGPDKDGDS